MCPHGFRGGKVRGREYWGGVLVVNYMAGVRRQSSRLLPVLANYFTLGEVQSIVTNMFVCLSVPLSVCPLA